jgi:hypothetical protein
MPAELYLDTARFGLATASARRAQLDYVRLCAAEGGSGDVDELLRWGSDAWPRRLRRRYGGLSSWQGVTRLKQSLRALAGAPPNAEVLLANRSAQLMKLAARSLFLRCQKVLHTDLEWPGYLAILEAERRRTLREVLCVPVRGAVFRENVPARDLAEWVAAHYRRQNCDGLFLSAVTYEGVRLPVSEILGALSNGAAPRFVVIDGAQALGHVPPPLDRSDLYLAGCHKWLRAGHPLGIAFAPLRGSRGFLRTTRDEMVQSGNLDDPLLSFTEGIEDGSPDSFTETVDVAPLFACAATVCDPSADHHSPQKIHEVRVANAEVLADVARPEAWQPLVLERPLRSGIVLLEAQDPAVRGAAPEEVRAAFQRRGVALTTYGDGLLRLSLPGRSWQGPDLDRLRAALRLYG